MTDIIEVAKGLRLDAGALYQTCDPWLLGFETTDELKEPCEGPGRERALEALKFGTGIKRQGYNLFALGPAGMGKQAAVRRFIEQMQTKDQTAADWCYVNNFADSLKPVYLRLPPGKGAELRDDVAKLVEELKSAIQSAFESESYRTRRQAILDELKEQQEEGLENFRQLAEKQGVALLQTPTGFGLAPMKGDEVIPPEEFSQLTEEEREKWTSLIAGLHSQLQRLLQQVPQWERQSREKLKSLNNEVTTFAAAHLIEELKGKYVTLANVREYLEGLQKDVIENVDGIINPPEAALAALFGPRGQGQGGQGGQVGSSLLRRYEINLLVDRGGCQLAPLVYEDHPTFQNLIGQIEYVNQFGSLVTDFNLIRPGALHKANGGYLLLDAHKVLLQPYAWEGLKRILRSGEISVESLGESLGLITSVSIKPQPIPLSVKVVLFGDRQLYYLLCHFDPEFNELFKVAVDFEEEAKSTGENCVLFCRMIASIAQREGLLPLEAGGVARVIEQSRRFANDQERLFTHASTITDLMREADYWCRQRGAMSISAADVQAALNAQELRADRARQRLLDETIRGTLLIDTDGSRIGQVNGLAVASLDRFAFGHPTRITATVRLGKGEVIDIEREVAMGGPIHTKGVLILGGYLASHFAVEHPLSLSASLVFEQSYSGVEGDSASLAELCALMSALAEVPLLQNLAVTGSVNQKGDVQAIGGVNEKIEGFYDLCQSRGLTGRQGVVIPEANVGHLMLRRDVVEAVKEGRFSLYAVRTVDEGIAILTGRQAGSRGEDGSYEAGSINRLVEDRLIHMASRRAEFSAAAGKGVEK